MVKNPPANTGDTGDVGSIPGSRCYILIIIIYFIVYFPDGSGGKNAACNAGDTADLGSFPGSGRSSGGGNGHPLQYYCLENPMNTGAWWATVHGVIKELDTTKHIYIRCLL